MSKERELLEETLIVLGSVHMDECDLYFAIEELLAQSEPEQEPLSNKEISQGFMLTDLEYNYDVFKDGVRWAEEQHKIGVDDE
jgi:hypothetical protein